MSRTTVRRSASNQFVQLPKVSIARSAFDRSHGWKSTFNSGRLIPFFLDEVLPGDTFNLSVSMLVRMTTPMVPIMDNVYLRTEFFFVPNRLVWKNFQRFMGEQPDGPDQSIDFLVPMAVAPSGGYSYGSIADYLGLPTGVAGFEHSDLPLRAIALIYNEWYRDENIMSAYNIANDSTGGLWTGDAATASGSTGNVTTDSALLYSSEPPRRAKFHDYFTSALPWPQKGEAVSMDLGNGANYLSGNNSDGTISVYLANGSVGKLYNHGLATDQPLTASVSANSNVIGLGLGASFSINDLREAFQVQKFLERNARGGTRYTEILRSHFGVVSPDARLQRPEFLGASKSRINITPVQQTSATDSKTTPQGNLAAYAVGVDSRHGFTKSFVEHGFVVGFLSVQTDLTYQQGLNRMWSRQTRNDYYWPVFAHLGEQAILNKEIYCQGTDADDDVFGYQERYAEYRYFPSMITGKLRSTDAQSLDIWHLAQEFSELPKLSTDFILENAPFDRVSAVPSEPEFIADVYFNEKCVRPIPLFGEPGLVDHF